MNKINSVKDLVVGNMYRWVAEDGGFFFPKENPDKWIGTCTSIEMEKDGEIVATIDFPEGILLLAVTEDCIGDIEEVTEEDLMVKLGREGLNKALGFAPKHKDFILLEGSRDYVRFTLQRHTDVEWSVKRNPRTILGFEVTMENEAEKLMVEW